MAIDVAGDLERWLAEHREPLIRRWLELVVERSSLAELAERPLGERMRELELLLEAARDAGAAITRGGQVSDLCAVEIAAGRPFALVLLAPPPQGPAPEAWLRALSETAPLAEHGDRARVAAAPGGLAAVLLPLADPERARVEADRLRVAAWQLLGADCPLPEAGVALHPADAADAEALLAVARERLAGAELAAAATLADAGADPGPAGDPEPAAESSGWPRAAEALRRLHEAADDRRGPGLDEPADLWRELSARRRRDDDGPPAEVTPLRPPR